jgi:hypothetical protein
VKPLIRSFKKAKRRRPVQRQRLLGFNFQTSVAEVDFDPGRLLLLLIVKITGNNGGQGEDSDDEIKRLAAHVVGGLVLTHVYLCQTTTRRRTNSSIWNAVHSRGKAALRNCGVSQNAVRRVQGKS